MTKAAFLLAGALLMAGAAQAQPLRSPTQAETCASVPAADEQDLAVLDRNGFGIGLRIIDGDDVAARINGICSTGIRGGSSNGFCFVAGR